MGRKYNNAKSAIAFQKYTPEDIQKLLNSSKLKREVYQELKVSEYVLNNYIKHLNRAE